MITSVQPSTAKAPPAAECSRSCGAGPEARVLALIILNQLTQGESARTDVNLSQEELKQLRETVREALEEAREAGEDSGFWGDIGDVLGGDIATIAEVVVVAAATVATGGAAALVLGAIAVACTLASKYADELGIPPKVAIGIGIAAAVASVASGNLASAGSLTGIAGASQTAAAVGEHAAQATRLVKVANDVRTYASLVSSAATAGGAVANTASGYYHAESVDHNAAAHAAKSRGTLEQMDLDSAVDLLSKSIDRTLAALGEAAQIAEAAQNSKRLLIQSFQGVA